jgi:hypothetical protein
MDAYERWVHDSDADDDERLSLSWLLPFFCMIALVAFLF